MGWDARYVATDLLAGEVEPPPRGRGLYGPDDVVATREGLLIKAERVRRPVTTERETLDAIDVVVRARRELTEPSRP